MGTAGPRRAGSSAQESHPQVCPFVPDCPACTLRLRGGRAPSTHPSRGRPFPGLPWGSQRDGAGPLPARAAHTRLSRACTRTLTGDCPSSRSERPRQLHGPRGCGPQPGGARGSRCVRGRAPGARVPSAGVSPLWLHAALPLGFSPVLLPPVLLSNPPPLFSPPPPAAPCAGPCQPQPWRGGQRGPPRWHHWGVGCRRRPQASPL